MVEQKYTKMKHITLKDLRTFEGKLQSKGLTIADLGFYFTTTNDSPLLPVNKFKIFAETGGNNVHYCYTEDDNENCDGVFLCVPAAPKIIYLGENLREFLSVGCIYGFGDLENLAFEFDSTIEEIRNASLADLSEDEEEALSLLQEEFKISPPVDLKKNLMELQDKLSKVTRV